MDNTKYKTAIYGVLDTVAQELIGGLQQHKHDAAAVRMYSDVASMKDSMIARHPQDYDLIKLGYITLNNTIEPTYELILKGATWAAALQEVEAETDTEQLKLGIR